MLQMRRFEWLARIGKREKTQKKFTPNPRSQNDHRNFPGAKRRWSCGPTTANRPTAGAAANFTKGLSKMVLDKGIRVNAVAPGPVNTPDSRDPAARTRKKFGADTSFERPAQPVQIAPLYVFLAFDESSYVSGEI
jgi:NAD(P)-dependent dehydrogenase (short-subunit alcohol dehydrogenase family)